MNQVRQQIGHKLVDILHQCNLADVTEDMTATGAANDLNAKCACQTEAYGHIASALTSMGFNRAREVYAETGSTSEAHAAIDEQYGERYDDACRFWQSLSVRGALS